jgi:hypothetical protein
MKITPVASPLRSMRALEGTGTALNPVSGRMRIAEAVRRDGPGHARFGEDWEHRQDKQCANKESSVSQ